jgi:hypothetical protein
MWVHFLLRVSTQPRQQPTIVPNTERAVRESKQIAITWRSSIGHTQYDTSEED